MNEFILNKNADTTKTQNELKILDKIGCGNITPSGITRVSKRYANRNEWPLSESTDQYISSTPVTHEEEKADLFLWTIELMIGKW